MTDRATAPGEVFDLFERWGDDPYDETVSQLTHALQTAALAEADGAAEHLIAAALLHDVGHLLAMRATDPDAPAAFDVDLTHEAVGAAWLASILPPSVTAPIALHVRAKRYWCAVDPGYADRLSEGSARSLHLQGGPMGGEEITAFERVRGYEDAVRVRAWDDAGKVDGLRVPPLAHYRPLVERLALPVERSRGDNPTI